LLTISGLINLMAVKNDFHLEVADAPRDKLMEWIKIETPGDAVFLAPAKQLSAVTLAGRKSYLGPSYYLDVMGYDYSLRREVVTRFYEADDLEIIGEIRDEEIDYVLLPTVKIDDFNYTVLSSFWQNNLELVYEDSQNIVYKL